MGFINETFIVQLFAYSVSIQCNSSCSIYEYFQVLTAAA